MSQVTKKSKYSSPIKKFTQGIYKEAPQNLKSTIRKSFSFKELSNNNNNNSSDHNNNSSARNGSTKDIDYDTLNSENEVTVQDDDTATVPRSIPSPVLVSSTATLISDLNNNNNPDNNDHDDYMNNVEHLLLNKNVIRIRIKTSIDGNSNLEDDSELKLKFKKNYQLAIKQYLNRNFARSWEITLPLINEIINDDNNNIEFGSSISSSSLVDTHKLHSSYTTTDLNGDLNGKQTSNNSGPGNSLDSSNASTTLASSLLSAAENNTTTNPQFKFQEF
ncbi:unnamed protein product [[Candida] boidinii]|nr:unnamed protein product [[Candida] boidinii]